MTPPAFHPVQQSAQIVTNPMPSLDILVPVLMGVALMWWIGRGMSLTAQLITAAATLILVIIVVAAERALR